MIELAVELNRRGIHADIITMYGEDISGFNRLSNELLDSGVPQIHCLGLKSPPGIAALFLAAHKFRRLVVTENYDLVETSLQPSSFVAAWCLRGLRTAHLVGIRRIYKKERETELRHRLFRLSMRLSSVRYYAISDYCAESWLDYSGTDRKMIRTVYNSIPEEFFYAASESEAVKNELAIPRSGHLILYVGRLAAYKGLDNLIEGLGPILSSSNLFLVCVGRVDETVKGTQEMMNSIERRIDEEGWGENIRFLGERTDVVRLMTASDLLVHLSQTEAFGRTLAEALAVGLNVIATDVEAIPEVLHGSGSILIPPDDKQALLESVQYFLGLSEEERQDRALKCRNRAQEFRIEKRTRTMIQLFHDVISGQF